ncbi:hypothetical protein CAPTEDRAFT_189292 [Capitella teleta]|uniref:Apple domain-containing protein n=1 Tax=Capitella teleta TaxID=283909 RepID=R7UJD1_CAPTE|nr:hypothetical protein CAPTEDRAFT_189292 [Capitella teleta]|eukprot:ELU06659.1 hypothetical protein CAPTEDRAFT_189292 [Capitella teleta]
MWWIIYLLWLEGTATHSCEMFEIKGHTADLDFSTRKRPLNGSQIECAIHCVNIGNCPGFEYSAEGAVDCRLAFDSRVGSQDEDGIRKVVYQTPTPKVNAAVYHVAKGKYLIFINRLVYEYENIGQMAVGPSSTPYPIEHLYPDFKATHLDAIVAFPLRTIFNQILFYGDTAQKYISLKSSASFTMPATLTNEFTPIPHTYGGSRNYLAALRIQVCFESASNKNCTQSIKYKTYYITDTMAHQALGRIGDVPYLISNLYNASFPLDAIPGLPPISTDVTAAVEIHDDQKIVVFSGLKFRVFDIKTRKFSVFSLIKLN